MPHVCNFTAFPITLDNDGYMCGTSWLKKTLGITIGCVCVCVGGCLPYTKLEHVHVVHLPEEKTMEMRYNVVFKMVTSSVEFVIYYYFIDKLLGFSRKRLEKGSITPKYILF